MKEGKAVTLVRHVKTASGWRYLDAAIADNGRVLANQVIVKIKITPGLPLPNPWRPTPQRQTERQAGSHGRNHNRRQRRNHRRT